MELKISKYLKGQSGPTCRHITFLDHQGFQLDPLFVTLRCWIIKDSSWIPLFVTLRFWIIKEARWISLFVTLRFWIIK